MKAWMIDWWCLQSLDTQPLLGFPDIRVNTGNIIKIRPILLVYSPESGANS